MDPRAPGGCHPHGQDRRPLQHIPAGPRHVLPTARGNDLSVPHLGLAATPLRGATSRGAAAQRWLSPAAGVPTARAGKRGQLPDPQKNGFAAACFLLLPRRLRKSFCLRCSSTSAVRTGKIPPCSQEHHRQMSQFFLLWQEKKKKKLKSPAEPREAHRVRNGMRGPGRITAFNLGFLPAFVATDTERAGNATPGNASWLPADHPHSNAPRRLLLQHRALLSMAAPASQAGRSGALGAQGDPTAYPGREQGQGFSPSNPCKSKTGLPLPPATRGKAGESHPTVLLCTGLLGFFVKHC